MDSASVKKEKKSAASKASKTIKNDVKIHKANKDEKKKKGQYIKKSSRLPKGSGVIYIGHIPHGFYEDEMKSYFSQFGTVTETALARSKKTGRSRGYGFVEFKDKEVAKIAAETMNNYLMYNRIMKCRYIPPEERKVRVNRGTISATHYTRQEHRKTKLQNFKRAFEKLDQTAYLKKVQAQVNRFKKFFEEKGIDFTYKFDNEESKVQAETPETKKTVKASEPKIKQEIEDQFGVLEIDESENEISFQTPPQVKKVIKKSVNSPAKLSKKSALSKKMQTKKEIKMNQLKDKKSKKIKEKEKVFTKSESKLKNTKTKLDGKVKTKVNLAQPVMTKKSSKKVPKDINAVIKQKNLKINKSAGVKESRKGEQVRTIKDKKANIKSQSS